MVKNGRNSELLLNVDVVPVSVFILAIVVWSISQHLVSVSPEEHVTLCGQYPGLSVCWHVKGPYVV